MYLGDFIEICDEDVTLEIRVQDNSTASGIRCVTVSTARQIVSLLKLFGVDRALDYGTNKIDKITVLNDHILIFLERGKNEG